MVEKETIKANPTELINKDFQCICASPGLVRDVNISNIAMQGGWWGRWHRTMGYGAGAMFLMLFFVNLLLGIGAYDGDWLKALKFAGYAYLLIVPLIWIALPMVGVVYLIAFVFNAEIYNAFYAWALEMVDISATSLTQFYWLFAMILGTVASFLTAVMLVYGLYCRMSKKGQRQSVREEPKKK